MRIMNSVKLRGNISCVQLLIFLVKNENLHMGCNAQCKYNASHEEECM